MTEITDAEAAEVLWASSEPGKAAFRGAWVKLHKMGLHQHVDATQLGQVLYAAHLAASQGGDSGKVYLATRGEYSDYRVCHAFARREDAEDYKLGDDVLELEVREGPVEVRRWHDLRWEPRVGDRAASWPATANPHTDSEYRDFDGQPRHAEHHWVEITPGRTMLKVGGWDLALVKKVYSEQRAQYLARKEGIA